ncbi:MAG: alpha/beta hydrolase [Polyangiales bacterium]
MAFERLGAFAAWAVTAPARRFFFKREGVSEIAFPSEDGLTIRGWLADVPDARGTVVLGHGYRDDRRQLFHLQPALAALGLRTVAIDFRAHGRSDGTKITIGLDEARDVRAALRWAESLGGPVSYVGFSMGAAAYLLSGVEAHAAILDAPYDTLDHAIGVRAKHVPQVIEDAFRRAKAERSALVIDEVRPIDGVAKLVRPTLFVFARGDAWIPPEVRAAFRALLPTNAHYAEVDGAHDAHFDTSWVLHVTRFLEKHAVG